MANEVLNMLFDVNVRRMSCTPFYVCLPFMFCFSFTLSSLGHVYRAGFCTSLKYMLQEDGCTGFWGRWIKKTCRRAVVWARWQHRIGHSCYDYRQQ